MSCILTTGRIIPCKAAFGGIKKVYFADYGSIDDVLVDSVTKEATIDPNSPVPKWYEYDVKGNSTLETTVTSSRENGTTFYTQTLNLSLVYLDAKTQAELQTIAVARPYVVVEDYYGNLFLCGFENGMELTGGTTVTGAAAADFTGFTITMEGIETVAPYFLSAPLNPQSEQIDPQA